MNARDEWTPPQGDEPKAAAYAGEQDAPRSVQAADAAAAPASGQARAAGAPVVWPRAADPRRKSVALAAILSMMPGLGHVYLGYYQLGFVHFLIFAGLVTILSSGPGGLEPLFGISLGFFVLYNFVDAGRRAALYNQALEAQAVALEPLAIPINRGSAVGGFVLMFLGVLFLMYTRFDFDMYWVEEWWPVALIALGAYLFIKDRQGRKQAR